ncbi:MAG: hydroxymethylbilane synthase, partial [Armatimonadota bacterium]|nr:hydroxymethylbilane synthase [Armatimonadota bacterium]
MQRTIRVGTRGSALATTQTQWVVNRLLSRFPGVSIVVHTIHTLADRARDVPLHQFRERGVFVKELEQALLQGEVDLAVHSLKDLPGEAPAGLVVAAVPPREDPRDALILRNRAPHACPLPLDPEAVIGCSSLRRRAQLRHLRPDLRFVNLRGNVDTRLGKLDRGEVDALVLAV